MKFYKLIALLALASISSLTLLAQSRFTPQYNIVLDETNGSKDQATRFVWAPDGNSNTISISGESYQDFTCFGIGVLPSQEISPLDISLEYKIGNQKWKTSEIEYTPKDILRDDLYWTNLNFSENSKSTSKIEFRIVLPEGVAIDSVKLHVINIDFSGETLSPKNAPKAGACPAYPTVITRAVWLDPYYTQPAYTPSVITPHHIVIHHGASPDTYTDGAAVVRSYWNYHVNSNGWSDIGYNYLTDKYGNIYKGRMNSDPQNQDCRGAHAGASNNESIGVNFLGNSDVTVPTEAQLDATADLLSWWFNARGYDPTASANITLQSGGTASVPRICGHKDVDIGGTSCPGGALYADLADLRTRTYAVINACNSLYTYGTSDGDFIDGVELDGEAAADISNTSSGTLDGPSYNDYTATHSADLIPGHSYSLVITNGDYGDETLAAWIDYDDDGSFELSEKLGEEINVDAAGIVTINFTVPIATATGSIKMRVRSAWSDVDIDASSVYAFGEAEDYNINIITPCTTPGTPINLLTSAVDDDEATFTWSTGTPAGSATVIYYWAVGLDGANPTYSTNYIDRGTTTSNSVTTSVALDPYTDYEWTVKAMTNCDWTESSYASSVDFTTSCITPGVPQSLTDSNITNTGVTLNWASNATVGSPVVTYYWAVNTSTTVNYETNYVKRGSTTSTMAEVYALLPGTNYYWSVRAETSCGVSSTSAYASYDGFSTTSIPVSLTWTGATSNEWNLASNWSPNQIPTIIDDVYIPDVSSGSNRYPISSWDLGINNAAPTRKCKSLSIAVGANVTLTGGTSNVFVDGVLDVYGTMNHECGSNSNLFQINSGGLATVYDGGVLNVGSSSYAGTPGGTVNQFNDLYVNGGTLSLEPGAKVYVMDNLMVLNSGALNMEGGELWVKYYGDGSANGLGFDVYAAASITISDGDIYLCGQDNGASAKMLDWNSAATISITGGTIFTKNEQSSGTLNYPGYFNFGGHNINNLTIDRTGATSYNDDNHIKIDGDFILSSGTFDLNNYRINIGGDVLNNGGTYLTSDFGVMTLEGSDNVFGGSTSTSMAVNSLTIKSGASYLFNPSAVTNFDVNGSFLVENNARLEIGTGKFLDLYAEDSNGESIYFQGEVFSSNNYDNNQEFDLNNACNFGASGDVDVDIRIWDDNINLVANSQINGDFEMYDGGTADTQGTLTFNSNETLTIYGDFTNDFGLVANAGKIVLAGSGKEILGDSNDNFNDLTIATGASYTLNTSVTNINIDGDFDLQSGATLNIPTGKFLDFYSTTSESETVVFDGDIISATPFDGTQEIDFNNDIQLSGSGNINADIRIFDNTTTLTSDFILDGDFETYNVTTSNGVFVMTDQMFTVNGDFNNNYRFIRGTGTIKFSGSEDQLVDCGCSNADCNANVEDTDYRRLNKVIVECASGKVVKLANTHMRTSGDFTVNSGTFTTGDGTGGLKINIYGITTIEDGAFFNVGNSVFNSGDVADFHDNLIVRGEITTDRTLLDGYAEVRSYASRLFAEGDIDEIYADVQVYLDDATEQLSDLYISGDLIIQSANEFKCLDPNHTLTIGGDLFIYHNFTHYGTVNLYGDFRENTPVGWEAEVCDIASSTFNMYGNKMINFNPSSGFGNLNIISGTRSINESGGQTPYTELNIKGNLTIEDGASLDAGTDSKDIDIEGNWIVQGTGSFVPGTEVVTFSSSIADQYVYLNTPANCVFYQFDVDKSSGDVILQSDAEVSRQIDLYSGGVSLSSNELYLSGATNSINSFMDGGSYSGYIVSESSDNAGIFKRNYGTSATKYFPLATSTGASLAMIITNNNSGVDNLGDVSIATYPTVGNNTPLPTSPQAVSHLTRDVLTSDVHGQLVDRFWQIDASGTVNDVDITFTYVDDAWDSFEMTAQRWNGGDWDHSPVVSSHNTTDNTVTVENITAFSPWVVVKKDWQLPIELLSFDANLNGKVVDLNWVTTNEYNNDYFEIERSLNLNNVEIVGRLGAVGFSNSEIVYSMTDEKPYTGVSYYRLKQTDFDGTSTYSDWVAIEIKTEQNSDNNIVVAESGLTILSAYPNPTSGNVKVLFSHNSDERVQYSVIDYTGRLLAKGQHMAFDGENELDLDFTSYKDGVYIVVIQTASGIGKVKVIKRR